MTLDNPRLGLFFLALSIVACSADTAGAQQAYPVGTYAFILGVTEYGGLEDLPKAGEVAFAFAEQVERAYENEKIWLVTDVKPTGGKLANAIVVPPTEAAVRQLLLYELPKIPRHSLIIFYFAGHGVKVDHPDELSDSDLFLVLGGVPQSRFLENSIHINEVLQSLRRRPMCNVMVLLDCCFSGAENGAVQTPEDLVERLSVKGFMFSSSTRDQQSFSGIFTTSLIDIWRNEPAGGSCLSPDELFKELRKRVTPAADGYMLPTMWFGTRVETCATGMHQPSMLLVFQFRTRVREPVRFEFGEGAETRKYDFDPRQERKLYPLVYSRRMPKKPTPTKVIAADGTVLLNKVLVPKPEEDSFVELIPQDEIAAAGSGPIIDVELTARSAVSAAQLLEDNGSLRTGSAYWTAAVAKARADPGAPTTDLLAKAAASGTGDEKLLFAFAAKPTLYGAHKFLEKAEKSSPEAVTIMLESAGAFKAAAEYNHALAGRLEFTDNSLRQFAVYRAALNYKLAGLDQSVDDVLTVRRPDSLNPGDGTGLAVGWLPPENAAVVEKIQKQSKADLLANLEALRISPERWVAAQKAHELASREQRAPANRKEEIARQRVAAEALRNRLAKEEAQISAAERVRSVNPEAFDAGDIGVLDRDLKMSAERGGDRPMPN